MDKMSFSDWLTKKYVKWRGDSVGRQGTISEFAAQIGVGQSLVSQWMKPGGKVPTSTKAINGLVRLFGSEVYDVLGIDPPRSSTDPFIIEAEEILGRIQPNLRREAIEMLNRLAEMQGKNATDQVTFARSKPNTT